MRITFIVLVAICLAVPAFAETYDVQYGTFASNGESPVLRIDDALAIARAYVQRHHVDVSHSYVDSARLDLNRGGDRGKFWLVTWLRNEYANGVAIKAGQIYIHVYMDKSSEALYGE